MMLKLFVFERFDPYRTDGDCYGMAFAIAENIDDAKKQIIALYEGEEEPSLDNFGEVKELPLTEKIAFCHPFDL